MPNRFLEVEYDPAQFKLYAARKIEGVTKVLPTPEFKTISDAAYSITTDDEESYLIADTVDTTFTLSSGSFRAGSQITLISGASNQITLVASGVNLYSSSSNTSTTGTYRNTFAYSKVDLFNISTDKWVVVGDITADALKSYVVTHDSGDYVFNGSGLTNQTNPSLTLSAGQLLIIENQSGSSHPFVIKKGNVSGATTGAGLTNPGWARIDNNNTAVAADKLMVSFKETGDYYYICQNHSSMKGSITVQ